MILISCLLAIRKRTIMNEVIKQLNERKSVRVFTEEEIPEEIVQEILTSAVMAPTAGNQQLYTIIRVTDAEKKKILADSCDHQSFIAEAKLLLVFCADCLKWYEAFKDVIGDARDPGLGDMLLAVDDALIAAQNSVVAAQSFGIGSCYIGDIMENIEIQREVLELPEYVFPAALLVFGYPTEQQKERPKPERVDMKYIVHENVYHKMSCEMLRAMFGSKMPEGKYESWMKAFYDRKYNADFAIEMTRSVEKYMLQFKKEK